MILQALIEGGWTTEKEEEEEDTEKTEDTTMSTEPNENSLVQSILKGNDEQQMVQSALNSQNVSIYLVLYKNFESKQLASFVAISNVCIKRVC